MVGRFEEQPREKDRIEQSLGQMDALDDPRRAQPEPRQDEGHRVRDLEAARSDGHRRRRGEEEDDISGCIEATG